MAALNTSYALRVRRTAAERTLGDCGAIGATGV